MSQHKAVSLGILTSSLCLIGILVLGIFSSNKDKNDRYVSSPSFGSTHSAPSLLSSSTEDVGEGRSATRRHKKYRKSKRKSFKRT